MILDGNISSEMNEGQQKWLKCGKIKDYIIYFILLISLKETVVVKANIIVLYFGVYTNRTNDWDKQNYAFTRCQCLMLSSTILTPNSVKLNVHVLISKATSKRKCRVQLKSQWEHNKTPVYTH